MVHFCSVSLLAGYGAWMLWCVLCEEASTSLFMMNELPDCPCSPSPFHFPLYIPEFSKITTHFTPLPVGASCGPLLTIYSLLTVRSQRHRGRGKSSCWQTTATWRASRSSSVSCERMNILSVTSSSRYANSRFYTVTPQTYTRLLTRNSSATMRSSPMKRTRFE